MTRHVPVKRHPGMVKSKTKGKEGKILRQEDQITYNGKRFAFLI